MDPLVYGALNANSSASIEHLLCAPHRMLDAEDAKPSETGPCPPRADPLTHKYNMEYDPQGNGGAQSRGAMGSPQRLFRWGSGSWKASVPTQ